MKKKQLFPEAFIQSSLEYYIFNIQKNKVSIYVVLLSVLLLVMVSLPLVRIEVTSSVTGTIDTDMDHYSLSLPVSGQVHQANFKEGAFVSAGDTLIVLKSDHLKAELDRLMKRKETLIEFVHDLNVLLESWDERLKSSRYSLAQIEYEARKRQLDVGVSSQFKIFNRKKLLHKERVIADQEFEEAQANFENARLALELYKKEQLAIWSQLILDFENELESIKTNIEKATHQIRQSFFTIPADGVLQYLQPLSPNQHVTAGLKLGELSPSGRHLVNCWVPTLDIGLIKEGMIGTFRIDAYDYNYWGILSGEVTEISNHAYIIDQQPYFKVSCTLDQEYLILSGGQVGKLKKGMTVQANFIVAKRSLYQLLYDQVDDWINPQLTSKTALK